MKTTVSSASSAQVKAAVLTAVQAKANSEKTNKAVVIPTEKPTTEEKEIKKTLSIEELNDKAERLNLLRVKYNTIREKRKQLDSFSVAHDRNNAQLTLVDAQGMEIRTSNPASIGKLLKDWMCDLNDSLGKVEMEMRNELASFN